jgi:Flp pilus assembly protein TadG
MKMHLIKKTNNKGQAIVEFMLVIGIFVILLYGIVDLVHIGIVKHVLDSACREGVRAASSIPNLNNSNTIVFSRVRKIMIDGKVMTDARITKPLASPAMHFIRGGVDGGSVAQRDDIVRVTMQVEYQNVFSLFTGKNVRVTGEANCKYLI